LRAKSERNKRITHKQTEEAEAAERKREIAKNQNRTGRNSCLSTFTSGDTPRRGELLVFRYLCLVSFFLVLVLSSVRFAVCPAVKKIRQKCKSQGPRLIRAPLTFVRKKPANVQKI